MKIIIGREYNIRSQHRSKDDDSYIFRGIVHKCRPSGLYEVQITEFNVSNGQEPGDVITVDRDRFKSLVARTNIEANHLLSKEW